MTDTLPRIEESALRAIVGKHRSVALAVAVAALIVGTAVGLVATKGSPGLPGVLIGAPDGYTAADPMTINAADAARLGSDPAREQSALSAFRGGVLRRFSSASGDDQLAVLGYEFADDAAADSYLAHAVADFKRNVRGATTFDTGVEEGVGFLSRRSRSHFVFVYLAEGRFVFAITSGGRSSTHNADEGRALARAQHDKA